MGTPKANGPTRGRGPAALTTRRSVRSWLLGQVTAGSQDRNSFADARMPLSKQPPPIAKLMSLRTRRKIEPDDGDPSVGRERPITAKAEDKTRPADIDVVRHAASTGQPICACGSYWVKPAPVMHWSINPSTGRPEAHWRIETLGPVTSVELAGRADGRRTLCTDATCNVRHFLKIEGVKASVEAELERPRPNGEHRADLLILVDEGERYE